MFCAFHEHRYTYKQYNDCIEEINRLLNEVVIPDKLKNLFYQQQYISVIGALECYLYNAFMRQVCNSYDAYQKILSAHLHCLEYRADDKRILRGVDCLEKDFFYRES